MSGSAPPVGYCATGTLWQCRDCGCLIAADADSAIVHDRFHDQIRGQR